MKLIRAIDLRFSDRKKETEYMTIKRANNRRDFHVTVFVVLFYMVSIVIDRFIKYQERGAITALATVAIIVVLYISHFVIKNSTLYVMMLVLFSYLAYRLVIMKWDYIAQSRANFFFAGYSYAIFQFILFGKLEYTSVRILAVVLLFFLRYFVIVFIVDPKVATVGLFVRGIIIDLFILYYFHSREKTDRAVFISFDQKREELLKFKELLADTLPLGITVVGCTSLKALFSNAAFTNLFSNSQPSNDNQQTGIQGSEDAETTFSLDSLYGDENSIREIGKEMPEMKTSLMNNNYVCLKDIVKNLLQENSFTDKAISLTASTRDQENPRSFNAILKKIMWDGKDAIAVVFNDITYQEKLIYWKMANANKDKVIATVSHELRTPLNGIIGLLDMAEKQIHQPEALEYISLCKDNAHLLLSLVNSILDLHQISAGKLKLNISNTNIRRCIRGVLQLFHFQTSQKGISLSFSVNDDVTQIVNTDENRLKQIIINLIGNAIKFTSQGGIKVLVTNYEEDPLFLKVSVSDTGMGIKEEDQAKLFQMFGKLEDVQGVNKGGVGLGLTISNALAGILSGKTEEKSIQVTSQFGEGSTFSFLILKDMKASLLSDLKNSLEEPTMSKQQSAMERKELLTSPNDGDRIDSEENLLKGTKREKEDRDSASIQIEDISSKVNKYQTTEKTTTMFSLNTQNNFHTTPKRDLSPKEEFTEKTDKQNDNILNPIFSQQSPEIHPKQKSLICLQKIVPSQDNIQEKDCILIVDDNPFNLLVAENLVKDTGYLVVTAMGGHEAIKKMQDFKKDGIQMKAILMDCQMPVIDGYETSRILVEMMKKGEIDNIPIIAMTANNSEEDIQRCYQSGMVGHLTKPVSKKSLIEALPKKMSQ